MFEQLSQTAKPLLWGFFAGNLIGVVLGVIMFLWAPADLGPFLITVWFSGLAVAAALVLSPLIYLYKITFRIGRKQLRLVSAWRQGIIISVWGVSLLALNSLRQLSAGDIVLISLLSLLIEVYLRKNR